VWALAVELLDEGVELCLLLEQIRASGSGGLLFQSQMHALMAPILLRMAGPNALDGDAQA